MSLHEVELLIGCEGFAAYQIHPNSETFGPLLPVLTFRDEAEALRLANATIYGLAAYFYSRDVARVQRMAERLTFGNRSNI